MAIGSFVNGVFQGMQARDTMENNKRLRKMEDTRFEREGEQHGWRKESHELAMERARKAAARGTGYKASDIIRDELQGYSIAPAADTGASIDYGAGNGAPAPLSTFPQSNAPVGQGMATKPLQMSINQAIPAAPPRQVAQGPMEFDYVPGQGLMPRGVA